MARQTLSSTLLEMGLTEPSNGADRCGESLALAYSTGDINLKGSAFLKPPV